MGSRKERQDKRDNYRDKTEEWLEEVEKQRLERPLVERLRDCGPVMASDGYMSIVLGDYKDAHDAANKIEKLESIIQLIQDWAVTDFNEELLRFIRVIREEDKNE